MAVQFFYDNQIRRFLLQFIRLTSNFQVEFGTTDSATGKLALQTVPVFYGDPSRQASQLLRGMSENALSTVPAMAVHISGLQYDRERVQEPFHISKVHLRQQMVDPATGLPTSGQGDGFTVERMMPVPYRLTLKLDIWTSNTEQKLQLVEQIATLFNPSLEIQSTDNYIDWTSLSVVILTDVAWDARTVPMGTEEPISVATMTFDLPIWISPPAKLKKLGVVQRIIAGFSDPSGLGRGNYADGIDDPGRVLTKKTYNVMHYGVVWSGNTIRLINFNTPAGIPEKWPAFTSLYGSLKNGSSEIRLEQPNGHEVVGTIAFHPADDTLLLFDPYVDTLPTNTIKPVDAIIDPFKVNVDQLLIDRLTGNYKVAAGTRYLILNHINEIGNTEYSEAWSPNGQHFTANANDIIEFDGTQWKVSFDSQNVIDDQYLTNLTTNVQYRWTGEGWLRSVEGEYREGSWTLIL
jgi:hypothetical protein